MRYFIAIIYCLMFCIVPVFSDNAGTNSGTFLKIAVGAEASGAGGAYTSLAGGALASYWNPAGISDIKKKEAYFYHNQWIADIKQEFFSIALPSKKNTAFAFSFNYLSSGNIEKTEILNKLPVDMGNFSAYSYAVSAGVSKKFNDISAGFNLKLIKEKIDSYDDQAFAFDFGINYFIKNYNLKTSLAALNLGSKIKLDKESYKLPATLKLGSNYKLEFNGINIALCADLFKIVEEDLTFNLGSIIELPYDISVRTGYNESFDIGKKYSLGFGKIFKMNSGSELDINYAWIPSDISENAHNFSFCYRW
ncbi:MAG TPA: PorV/PorQ family protein [bacterium]|nr:PorV/PorQ family protein [bacterium]